MKTGINLHLHTSDDISDKVKYSFIEALDKCLELNIKITAITCHDKYIDYSEYNEEAKKRNMLFIPGIEKTINGQHVVILNADKESEQVNSLEQLREYKKSRPDIFILAPHPYLPVFSLNNNLIKYGDVFDAVELTWFYTWLINPNRKGKKAADKLNLPFISTSDAHKIDFIEKGFALIEVDELTIPSVFKSIRERRFENVTKPQSLFKMFLYALSIIFKTR